MSNEVEIPWPIKAVFVFLIILLWQWAFPTVIPFDTFEFFTCSVENVAKSLWAMIPLFIFGICVNIPALLNGVPTNETKNDMFVAGTYISLWAGIAEELAFRWIFFYGAFILIGILDWITGGFIFSYGLFGALYNWFLIPIANVCTFGCLSELLYHPIGWIVGAAIISANGSFRNGHEYQGFIGYVISWFAGMIFFYIMFTGGIFAAIVVHFVYDFIILSLHAIVRGK